MKNFEKNFIGKRWSLRIGWHQVALFRNRDHKAIINFFPLWSDRLYTFRKGLYIGNFHVL